MFSRMPEKAPARYVWKSSSGSFFEWQLTGGTHILAFDGRRVIELESPGAFQNAPTVARWWGFEGSLHSTTDGFALKNSKGDTIIQTTPTPVSFSLGNHAFEITWRIEHWKRRMSLRDGHGDIACSSQDSNELLLVRVVEPLPELLAMFWFVRLTSND